MDITDFKQGQTAEVSHKITADDIEKFVSLTGDDNKLHVDKAFAEKTSFKKPVAHGMLGASFISTVIGTKLPGDGALWFSQNLEFLLPVRVGDTITVRAEVIKIHARQGILELSTDVFNQNRQKVIAGSAKVKIVKQESKAEVDEKTAVPKTALVIGASGGIGTAIAQKLAENGYALGLHYYSNREKIQALREALSKNGKDTFAIQADITNLADISELTTVVKRKFGYLSTVVMAATVDVPGISFDNLEWEDIQKHIDINVRSAFYLIKALKPIFRQQKYGRVVGITTQYTDSVPPADMLHYVTAKSAMNGLYKSLAVDMAPLGVTVNLVSPGVTDTELTAGMPEKQKLLIAAKTPVKRIAVPRDVANAVSFLVSENSGFITGETIRVNGGQIML